MEILLDSTADLKGKQKENLENFREQALLSKQLATIVTDITYTPTFEDMVVEGSRCDQADPTV